MVLIKVYYGLKTNILLIIHKISSKILSFFSPFPSPLILWHFQNQSSSSGLGLVPSQCGQCSFSHGTFLFILIYSSFFFHIILRMPNRFFKNSLVTWVNCFLQGHFFFLVYSFLVLFYATGFPSVSDERQLSIHSYKLRMRLMNTCRSCGFSLWFCRSFAPPTMQ